jgi:hypothetical protein
VKLESLLNALLLQEVEDGAFEVRLAPTHLVRSASLEDLIPMLPLIHGERFCARPACSWR